MYRSKAGVLIHKFLLSKYIYKTIFLFDSGSKAVLFFFLIECFLGKCLVDSWSHADFSEARWTLLSIFC